MPFYDYECTHCGHSFEEFQAMKDDVLITCPSCKNDALRRLISPGSGIIFKGSGFYVNDSREKPASKQKTSAQNSPSGDRAAASSSSSGTNNSASGGSSSTKTSAAKPQPSKNK